MGEVILQIKKFCNFFGLVCTASDLDLKIEAGVLTSIIGPNGAGKSTLINLITGDLPVQSGSILFKEQDITRLPINKRVRRGQPVLSDRQYFPGIIGLGKYHDSHPDHVRPDSAIFFRHKPRKKSV